MNPDTGPRSALDQQLDSAARSVEEHVGDYVTPRFDPSAGRPRRSGATAATGVAAALLLIVGLIAFNGGDPSTEQDEIVGDDPVDDLAFAGPRDGLDSLRLPIEVTPAVGLADGQIVTVRGSQFPPATSLGVVMCIGYVNREPAGSANCQLSPYTSVTSDENGNFEVQHAVDRVFTTSGGELVDCAEANAEWTCIVAVGALADYDQSGIAPVSFDPGIPALPDPLATISPEGPYTDGQSVVITVENIAPGTEVFATTCVFGADMSWCDEFGQAPPTIVGPDGRGSITLRAVRKWDGGAGQSADCADPAVTCTIEVSTGNGYGYWSWDLMFVGGSAPPSTPATTASEPPPVVDVEPPGTSVPTTVPGTKPAPPDPPASSTTTVTSTPTTAG